MEQKTQKLKKLVQELSLKYRGIEEPDVPLCLVCGKVVLCGAKTFCSIKECPKK